MKKFALILLVVSACKSVKVERTVEYRDTTITVAADSAKILLRFIPCPDGTMPKVEGTDAKQGRKTSIKAKQNGGSNANNNFSDSNGYFTHYKTK